MDSDTRRAKRSLGQVQGGPLQSRARKFAGLFAAMALAFVLMPAPSSRAQELESGGGGDLVLFRPAIDSKGHITVNGTEVLGHLDYAFGLILDAGIGLMPYRAFAEDDTVAGADAVRERNLVDMMISGSFSFNLGIKNWLVVGAQLPVRLTRGAAASALLNDGTPFYNGGTSPVRALSHEGIGDITIHAKARLLRFDRDRKVGLAAIARLGVPTGKS